MAYHGDIIVKLLPLYGFVLMTYHDDVMTRKHVPQY